MAKINSPVARGGSSTGKKRVGMIDEVRGIALIGIVVYHLIFDLTAIYGINIPVFHADWVELLRNIGAGAFVFIAGTACHFTRSNLRRGAACLGIGLCLSLVTYVMIRDQFIAFGVLHCLGTCMLLFWILRPLLDRIPWVLGFLLAVLLFALTYNVQRGSIGLPSLFTYALPQEWYQTPFLFPLGLQNAGFSSSDYYPLLPWFFLFLAGSFFGVPVRGNKLPQGFYVTRFRSLAFIGRHTLLIYLVHQPLFLAMLELIFRIKALLGK